MHSINRRLNIVILGLIISIIMLMHLTIYLSLRKILIVKPDYLYIQGYVNGNMLRLDIIIVFFSVVVISYISSTFYRPLRDIYNTCTKLSKGDYYARCNSKSSIIEVKDLSSNINVLGERLKNQDKLRKRLVSDISHEIRTPLNILQNNLEAMIDGVFPISDERLNALNDEVIRFGKLLDNLNILKEFESKETMLELEILFLDQIISAVVEEFHVIAEEKDIKIHLYIDENSKYKIIGDRYKIKGVFVNLISNAIKFTLNGGEIWIELYKTKKHIIVNIRDTGIGIAKEDLPYIFERLYRGDKSRHKVEGSGIGLTITKKILLLHSATIDVKSEENKGALFIIKFPYKKGFINR